MAPSSVVFRGMDALIGNYEWIGFFCFNVG